MQTQSIQKPPKRTVESYQMLYEIENYLREVLKTNKINHKRSHYNASLFDLVNLVEKIPKCNNPITGETISKIYWIIDIRNKVCHMQDINDREFQALIECHEELFKAY